MWIFKTDLWKKVTWNRVPQIWSWYEAFIKDGSIGPIASRYLKQMFRKGSHEIGSIKYVAGLKYLSNIYHGPIRDLEKMSHEIKSFKYGPDM